jgi:hypothetical protein
MTRKHKVDWRLGVGLAAAVAFSGMSFTPASAVESWFLDNGDCKLRAVFSIDGIVTKGEAKGLARFYLKQIGFTAPRLSQMTAKLVSVEPDGKNWRATILYGGHIPNKRAILLINRYDGMIAHAGSAASVESSYIK